MRKKRKLNFYKSKIFNKQNLVKNIIQFPHNKFEEDFKV